MLPLANRVVICTNDVASPTMLHLMLMYGILFGRSATSVCANIAESKYGHSRADFIAKLEIALKEASETGKWLEMLLKSDYIDEETYKSINKTCSTIRILLIASIKTAKSKLNK